MIRVNAFGVPVPKGSKKLVTHGAGGRVLAKPLLVDDNSTQLQRWEKSIAGATLVAIAGKPRPVFGAHVALVVRMEIRLARPRSIKRPHPSVKPDTDKLARPLDALTGLVWEDDGQVVDLHVVKRYCAAGESPGAVIEIDTKEPQQTDLPIGGPQ